MTQRLKVFFMALLGIQMMYAQDFDDPMMNSMVQQGLGVNGMGTQGDGRSQWGRDTSQTEKVIPIEVHQWRIQERLGSRIPCDVDTLPHLFPSNNATDGLHGEYNILGNLGSPRLARNFLDREALDDFLFMQPFDFFHTAPRNILFTNTKSPYTNLTYNSCGGSENGQDRIRAYFATNINKIAGAGFKLDYLYGRGYYNNQANSQFGGTLFGYYLGDRYEMHTMLSWEHLKMGENGGITDDLYITDPQSFPTSYDSKNIPTTLSSVWNRNDQQTYYLTHRYNLGQYVEAYVPDSLRPVMPADEELFQRISNDSLRQVIHDDTLRYRLCLDSLRLQWQNAQVIPQEFIPVASIVHTFKLKQLTHDNYCLSDVTPYFTQPPFYRSGYDIDFKDETSALSLRNTLGIQMREGFKRWVKMGIDLFAAHEFRRFGLPNAYTDNYDRFDIYREHHVSIGGQISKTQGRTLHYNAGAEFWVAGPAVGDLDVYGSGDLNFRLFRDTVHFLVNARFQNRTPSFYLRHYHSEPYWWDNNLSRETRTRIDATLAIDRTQTRLRFGIENISSYAYLTHLLTPSTSATATGTSVYTYNVAVRQQPGSIQVMSATLTQNFHWGIFHWDNDITWQHSTNDDVLPLPTLSIFTNPYVSFKIAKVLTMEVGVDMRYFTRYHAMDYAPFLGQFCVQDPNQPRILIGNYPVLGGYVNLALKRVRGYVAVKHFNAGNGPMFWAPHYPMDPMSIHFGISWNFYN